MESYFHLLERGANNCSSNADAGQQTGERYPYQQLEHENTIRLLFITPGSGEEVSYTLQHAELGKTPYKALSYEWGLPSDDDPNITIDGHTVRIRNNLFNVLKQISSAIHHPDSMFLWIDALCINQVDDAEKSQQVLKMGKIFSSAEKVLAWTGLAAGDSDYAMDTLSSSENFSWEKTREDHRARTAILAWCNRPYFKRIWILQELYLAKRLLFMCGSKSVAERGLVHCLGVVLNPRPEFYNTEQYGRPKSWWCSFATHSSASAHILGLKDVQNGLSLSSTHRRHQSLLEWLFVCADFDMEATDPRDYIYAVLSITKETVSGHVQIVPDYTKSLKQVFEDTNAVMRAVNVNDRDMCPRCKEHLQCLGLRNQQAINKWLKVKLGLDVRIKWSDKSRRYFARCKTCREREREREREKRERKQSERDE